jgi:hypothetical protein
MRLFTELLASCAAIVGLSMMLGLSLWLALVTVVWVRALTAERALRDSARRAGRSRRRKISGTQPAPMPQNLPRKGVN